MVGSERASWEGRESPRRAGALRAAGGNSTLKNWKLSAAQLPANTDSGGTTSTPTSPGAGAVVEDLSGWRYEQLWGNNPVAGAAAK